MWTIAGAIIGMFFGVALGGTWVFVAPLLGFAKPTGEVFLWIVGVVTVFGTLGFLAFVKRASWIGGER
jgi:hypothetical protein